jgi:hypothetical protein
VITGVFGGSITALAYGLHGEKLFDDYETRFLKCNVQGELTTRVLRPLNWGHCRPLDGDVPSWQRNCTTRSDSTGPRSPTSIARVAR